MNWNFKPKITQSAETNLSDYGQVIPQLLFNRGITKKEEAELFLNPKQDQIHDENLLSDIEKASELIKQSIKDKQKIIVYGDYDVDGVVSTTLLWEYLYRELKADAKPYVPHKTEEGYGLNEVALKSFKKDGVKLIITVDNGIRDYDIIKKYSKDFDFIIIDHHALPDKLPPAKAIIHQLHPDFNYPFEDISAGVLVFKFIKYLSGKDYKDVPGLDLLALSIVCDLMPLIDENRPLVKLSLDAMRISQRPGLKALINIANVSQSSLEAYHLGYVLGPRINASGRIGHALDAVKLFATQDTKLADKIAHELDKLNQERQILTNKYYNEATENIDDTENIIIVSGNNWPEGILGLIAGKLMEKYNKPSIALSLEGELYKGSARSLKEFHIAENLDLIAELLDRYGGHRQAAGLSFNITNFDEVKKRLIELSNSIPQEAFVKTLNIDMEIPASLSTQSTLDEIDLLRPFGLGNYSPIFATRNVEILESRVIGSDGSHVSLQISDGNGGTIRSIYFRGAQKMAELKDSPNLDIAYRIELNEYKGYKNIQLNIQDIRESE